MIFKLRYCFNLHRRTTYLMSHQFYDYQTLQKGTQQMVELIKQCYSKTEGKVHPQVTPGFIRHQLPEVAPEQGSPIEDLLQTTKNVFHPGIMNWQSPKYFGYYPSSINVTSVIAQMYATTFQSPSFNFSIAPSFTELENIVVDWSAKAIGLPDVFLLKNSGGGIIGNSCTEAILTSVHVAKYAKIKELGFEGNNPDIFKLVGYYGEGAHISSHRALFIKDIYHKKAAPYRYNPDIRNYEIDYEKFVAIVQEDIKNGLIPFWFGGSFGNTFCGAVDMDSKIVDFCKSKGMWVNADAAFLGSTWISEKFRPKQNWLQRVDSVCVNFTKLLLSGTGGALFYVRDKKLINYSFGATAASLEFSFYKNQYSNNYDVVDYKDWIFGLARRNNSIKIYYTFAHYGLKLIRETVEKHSEKGVHLLKVIESHPTLFHVFTVQYNLVTFKVKDRQGKVSQKLTKQVAAKIKNAVEGFCTPAEYKGDYVIRIVVGNFHSEYEHINNYLDKIIEEAKQAQQKSL